MNESIAAARQRFYEPRRFSRIAERLAQALHRSVDAVVEVDDGVAGPELLAKLLAGDEIARMLQKERKHAQRLPLELYLAAVPAQFQGAWVELEVSEAKRPSHRLIGAGHATSPAKPITSVALRNDLRCIARARGRRLTRSWTASRERRFVFVVVGKQ